MNVYSIENSVFVAFLKFGALVMGKMLAMVIVTFIYRTKNKAYKTQEDAYLVGAKNQEEVKRILAPNKQVERVLNVHNNDMESIVPFVLTGMLYVGISPSLSTAILHFKVFTISRFFHTFIYLFSVPQPMRALSFTVGYTVTCSMVIQILMFTWNL